MATPTNMSVAPNMTPAPNMSVGTAAPVAPKPAPIVSGPAVVTSKPAITNVQKQTTDINQKSAAVNAQGLTAQQMGKFAGMTGSQGAAANTGGVTSSSIAAPAGAKLGGDGTLVSFDGGNTWTKNPALAAPSATPTQPTATPTAPSAGVTADKVPLNESRTGYAAGWTQTGTDANGNALFSPPATTPSAAAGGAGTTGTTATGAPADAGAAFAASIAASDARMQAAYDDHKAKIDQIMNGTYPLTDSEKSQLNNISQTFESLIAEQRQANVAYEQSVRVAGITAGRSMYAPEVELGNVKSAIDEGFRKISDLNVKMVTALETAKQAIKDNDVKMLDKMYQDLTSLETSKRASINDLYRISMDSLKEARDVAADKRADAQFEFQKEQAKQAPINAADARIQAAAISLAEKYPDAGILPTDSLASASAKVKQSPTYIDEAAKRAADTKKTLAEASKAGQPTINEQIAALDHGFSISNNVVTNPSQGIVGGFNISSYATKPTHEAEVASLLNGIGKFETLDDVSNYIKKTAPNSPITADMISKTSAKYGVPWEMLVAMMQEDSSLGTQGKAVRTFNPGNVGNDDSGNLKNYGNWQSGVDAVGNWLSKHRDLRGGGDQMVNGLSRSAIESMAQDMMLGKPIPSFGNSKAAAEAKKAVLNRYAEIRDETGVSPGELNALQVQRAADSSALKKMQPMADIANAAEKKAEGAANIVLGINDSVWRTSSPMINSGLIFVQGHVFGDSATQNLSNAVQTLTTEYGKVIANATGNAELTVSAQQAAERRISAAGSRENIIETIKLLKQEMANAVNANNAQLAEIRGRLQGSGETKAVNSKADVDALPVGATFLLDGKRYKKNGANEIMPITQ